MANPTVLILQMGLNERVGSIFGKVFTTHGVDVEIVKVPESEVSKREDWKEYDGILLTGSSFMVTDLADWSVATANKIRPIVEEGIIPVFGVCYGHQLLVHCLGGEVDYASKRQVGTKDCSLNTELIRSDPVFSLFGDRSSLTVHVLHRQIVTRIPTGVTVLAKSDADAFHALRVGRRCWSVQFHPELLLKNMRAIVELSKPTYADDGLDYEQIKASLHETMDGVNILERFADICRERFNEKGLSSL